MRSACVLGVFVSRVLSPYELYACAERAHDALGLPGGDVAYVPWPCAAGDGVRDGHVPCVPDASMPRSLPPHLMCLSTMARP